MYIECGAILLYLQAKVLDRDGYEQMECPKGWQYIADMGKTEVSSVRVYVCVCACVCVRACMCACAHSQFLSSPYRELCLSFT